MRTRILFFIALSLVAHSRVLAQEATNPEIPVIFAAHVSVKLTGGVETALKSMLTTYEYGEQKRISFLNQENYQVDLRYCRNNDKKDRVVFWSFKDVLASIDKLEERGEVDDFMAFHKQGYGRALNIQKFRVQLLELYELEKSQKNFNSDHASRNLQHAIHRNWAVRAIVRYTAIGLATGFYPEFSYYRIMTANNLDNLHISLPVVLNFFPANRKSLLHMWLSGNMSLDILAHPPDMANIAGTVFRARNWTSLSIPTDPIQVSGDEELKSTIDHELGHYFGLRHVFAKQGKKGTAERIFYDLANDPKSTCGKGQWLVAENNRIRDWDGVKGVYDTLPSANSLLKKGDQEGYLKTPCFTEYKSVYDSSSAPASQKLAMRADMNLMSYSSAKKRGFTADQLEQMASSIKSVLATNSTAGVCKND